MQAHLSDDRRAECGAPAALPRMAADDAALRRFEEERSWLAAVPGVSQTAACLLAAHAVGCLLTVRPSPDGVQGMQADPFSALASACPNHAALAVTSAALLNPLEGGGEAALDAQTLSRIEALWTLASPTEYLLASGGDDRLTLDGRLGVNKYGCSPWPRPAVISFGSCTASSLSEGAFQAAEQARRSLLAASVATSPATALAEASEAIGAAILRHFQVEDLAEAVLAASGTDAALVVTGLLAAEHPGEALTSIVMSASETGSGVPDAVQGRHFAACAPTGSLVFKGQPIDGLSTGPSLVTLALRDGLGAPLGAAAIDAACDSAIRQSIARGRAVLHAIDGSKTGLTAPDRAACRRLAERFGDRLDIVIDACQARIEPELVRWYLRRGFPVLITGSKFFAAPGFCGAVLFPRARLERITRAGRLPAGLAAYARLQGGFGSRRCPGLVLRWSAALHEMGAFARWPATLVRTKLDRFGRAVRAAVAADARLRLIEAPRPAGMGWSDCHSVFTFAVRGGVGGWMGPAELRGFYRALDEQFPNETAGGGDHPAAQLCQLGQPVELGTPSLGGLRIALSAAQVAADDQTEHLALVIGKLSWLLDHQALLAREGTNRGL